MEIMFPVIIMLLLVMQAWYLSEILSRLPAPKSGMEQGAENRNQQDRLNPVHAESISSPVHHGNILSARRSPWLAIDPKGVVGPPAFEVGAFMKNPLQAVMSDPDPAGRLARRTAILSEHLGFARPAIRDWAFIQAMLSVEWTVEDQGRGWEQTLSYAVLLDGLEVD